MIKMLASVIICTYNRAESLRQTLAVMGQVCVTENLPAELLVIDNGSTDHTADVVKSCCLPNMPVRYIHESGRGLSHARNTGIKAAKGDIILFTDDDVRPPHNWIIGMCEPILSGKTHAVAGGIRMAPHLERSWMESVHRMFLADTRHMRSDGLAGTMIGANMAFLRQVLATVPSFDAKLGAGTLGFGEDTLFGMQLQQAGFSIAAVFDVIVEHHFDEQRLLRASFLNRADGEGQATAYISYHWLHSTLTLSGLRLAKQILQLAYWRMRKRRERRLLEGCPEWELRLISEISFHKRYLIERKRPRNYEKHGLVKIVNG